MSDLWLVTRKDIPVPMEPSYFDPWQWEFNRRPRTYVYRQRASAMDRANKLAAKGALESIKRFSEVETIMAFDVDWVEPALDTEALDDMTGGNPYGH
jgi:hypothetical protein